MKIPALPVFASILGCGVLFQSAAAQTAAAPDAPPPYLDRNLPIEKRVEDLLGRLTVEEKISLLHGNSTFSTAPIPRLGIPERTLSDGPMGVREEIIRDGWNAAGWTNDFSTAFPCGICLAATWNPALARSEGEAIAEEARARGKDIMLGPAVNIMRSPLNGRNFEYMGEDPFLAGKIVAGFIAGEQSRYVASSVKHFAANNQETNRNTVDVQMDERTLREIYLPAFETAVKEGGALTVMAAYNRLRGEYCAQNDYLLNQILKGEWGFKGLVMTDWGAAHNTDEAVRKGLDLEMGTGVTRTPYDEYYLARPFREGVQNGTYPMSLLDDKARRNLYVMFATYVLDGRPPGSINTQAHLDVSRRVAEEGMVLLKNDSSALPLDAGKISSLAVIGDNAVHLQASGGQSSGIKAFTEISPLSGILGRVGSRVNVTFAQGYLTPSPARPGARGNRGRGQGRGAEPALSSAELIDQAARAAKQADVAIVFAGLNKNFDTEGSDRPDMKLPAVEEELIGRVVEANPRTIVVLVAGSPVEMGPWLQKVPAVLLTWYGGSEAGVATARALFGDVNPSGKLPCTFPKQLSDVGAHSFGPETFPGQGGVETYTEGLLVGYRWFDTKNIEPLFPFGYGLSYTTFEYSNLKLVPATDASGSILMVQFDVANTGSRLGAEVPQLYIHQDKPALPRPAKELKGFSKIFLQPGQKETVTIPLNQRSFAYYDPEKKGWLAESGTYQILVGSSSRDIRLKDTYSLTKELFAK